MTASKHQTTKHKIHNCEIQDVERLHPVKHRTFKPRFWKHLLAKKEGDAERQTRQQCAPGSESAHFRKKPCPEEEECNRRAPDDLHGLDVEEQLIIGLVNHWQPCQRHACDKDCECTSHIDQVRLAFLRIHLRIDVQCEQGARGIEARSQCCHEAAQHDGSHDANPAFWQQLCDEQGVSSVGIFGDFFGVQGSCNQSWHYHHIQGELL
mmetsp:Transcript_95653/g.175295  ORF Transcript_95653/g.175295 Transcript_95653/m.175295 type:complete len:208 (-) Transcript_95653:831-1454(-)